MKRKYLYFCIIICGFSLSCTKDKGTSAKVSISSQLDNSATFKKYMTYESSLETGLVIDKYNMSNVDFKYISSHVKGVHSHQGLIDVYTKAGMDNAADYLANSLKSNLYYLKLKAEVSDVSTLNSRDFATLSHKVYYEDMHVKKLDYVNLKEQRRVIRLNRLNLKNN
ncbi:hypothetical protein SAMN05421821_101152 [Mucilaginibacter lappiensis]|uniref:DUF4296 domain-containing protein n=1 Tax=Mucilaginibacter lappiensis TaxID=354630 RepID=A0ABR6PDT7_9SPHI|nr:hypothetical protein [Mucilaginibacter lappiensis]MBB6107933.1 hypothetical protein [Mucilaginibacter lappiensis]SIP92059.1 hypothetical protein SAMN05421821_101152 [Mucilaginibacter lappiensis]